MMLPSVVCTEMRTVLADATAGTRHVIVSESTNTAIHNKNRNVDRQSMIRNINLPGDVKSPPKMHLSIVSSNLNPVMVN